MFENMLKKNDQSLETQIKLNRIYLTLDLADLDWRSVLVHGYNTHTIDRWGEKGEFSRWNLVESTSSFLSWGSSMIVVGT